MAEAFGILTNQRTSATAQDMFRPVCYPMSSDGPRLGFNASQSYLVGRHFSDHIAKWISTNLRPLSDMQRELVWSFDLDGIAQMYSSYEHTSLWPFLREPQVCHPLGRHEACQNPHSNTLVQS